MRMIVTYTFFVLSLLSSLPHTVHADALIREYRHVSVPVEYRAQETISDAERVILDGARAQLTSIDVELERLGLTLNNKKIKKADAATLKKEIREFRTFLHDLQEERVFAFNRKTVTLMVDLVHQLTLHVDKAVKDGFTSLPMCDIGRMMRRTPSAAPHDIETLELLLLRNQEALTELDEHVRKVGMSILNTFMRSLAERLAEWNVPTAVKRMLPYAALGTWLTIFNDDETVHDFSTKLPQPLANILQSYKGLFNWIGEKYQGLLAVPTMPTRSGGSESSSSSSRGYKDRLIELKEEPLVKFGIASMMGPIIMNDIKDLSHAMRDSVEKARAKANNEHPDIKQDVKEPKLTFSKIIGLDHIKEQLGSVVTYLGHLKEFERTGLRAPQGILFVGPASRSKKTMAEALAGEIDKALKVSNPKKSCGYCSVHASKIIKKGLDDILKEAESKAPCVLFIDGLDWLDNTADHEDKKLYSNVLASIDAHLKNKKKSRVIIVASALSVDRVDPALIGPNRFATVVEFTEPTHQDRVAFLERELHERCIDTTRFDLDSIAFTAEGLGLGSLNELLHHALMAAQTNNEVLAQHHFESAMTKTLRLPARRGLKEELEQAREEVITSGYEMGEQLKQQKEALEQLKDKVAAAQQRAQK